MERFQDECCPLSRAYSHETTKGGNFSAPRKTQDANVSTQVLMNILTHQGISVDMEKITGRHEWIPWVSMHPAFGKFTSAPDLDRPKAPFHFFHLHSRGSRLIHEPCAKIWMNRS